MSKNTLSTSDYQTYPSLFELEPVGGKKVVVDFTAPELSSLGGLTFVREYERSSCRILDRIESCINDPRFAPMVVYSQSEMIRQRMYQIMAGFEDADDCNRLCRDGILKMCASRTASDEGQAPSERRVNRREEDMHTPALLAESPDDAGDDAGSYAPATSAAVITVTKN